MFPQDTQDTEVSELVVNAAGAAMFLLDRRGSVTAWNFHMTALTGISKAEFGGRNFVDILPFESDRKQWLDSLSALSAAVPACKLNSHWKTSQGLFVPLSTNCVLLSPVKSGEGFIVCTVDVPDPVLPSIFADRADELSELARYVHDTIAQDLVQLSFYVEMLDRRSSDSAPQSGRTQPRDLVELCCSRIRVFQAMLAPPPHGVPLHQWLENYAEFFRNEMQLAIELDVDPLPPEVPEAFTRLMASVIQLWIAKAVRRRSVQSVFVLIRVREPDGVYVLFLQAPPTEAAKFLNGWSAFRRRAELFGGTLNLGDDSLTLTLPIATADLIV